jgi:hypothetical protein
LNILKTGNRQHVADLVPFCGGSCGRCSLMQGGTGQGKPDRSEYRVRPGLKIARRGNGKGILALLVLLVLLVLLTPPSEARRGYTKS